MRILNFGSINYDFVYKVDEFPTSGETITSKDYHKYFGGKGLNQSVAIANSGLDVVHAGQVGFDGLDAIEYLNKFKITSKLSINDRQPTGHALIQVNNSGKNNIILYEGSNKNISEEFIDEVFQDFQADDFLVIQNEINAIPYIINKANEIGMKIFFNPAPFDDDVKKYPLRKIDYFILNEHEAMGLTDTKSIQEALTVFKEDWSDSKIIVTLGELGSCYIYNNKINYFGRYEVKTVDTTSAGDTFIGYFVSGIANKKTIQSAILVASKAAAITVSKKGTSITIPKKEVVENSHLNYLEMKGELINEE